MLKKLSLINIALIDKSCNQYKILVFLVFRAISSFVDIWEKWDRVSVVVFTFH